MCVRAVLTECSAAWVDNLLGDFDSLMEKNVVSDTPWLKGAIQHMQMESIV